MNPPLQFSSDTIVLDPEMKLTDLDTETTEPDPEPDDLNTDPADLETESVTEAATTDTGDANDDANVSAGVSISSNPRVINGITIPPPIRISPEPTAEEAKAMIPRKKRRRSRWRLL